MPTDLYDLNSAYGSESELIKCIDALHSVGIKAIGDAVINHRCAQFQDSNGIWNKYGGKLNWDSDAIVGDDPNFRGRGHRSSGDTFKSAPNIDHRQVFVKKDIQEWLVWLRKNIGFDGWRIDFVRGFAGSHVKDYMDYSTPQFAVGEYWDAMEYDWGGIATYNQDAHRQRIVNWIDSAGSLSMAFDFTTKGIMHAAFERYEYWRLRDANNKPPGVLGWWPNHAVTFIDNHDTGSTQGHWRFPTNAIEQGYAYILTHPGTPCVFWDHLNDGRMCDIISRMLKIRRRNDIWCDSKITICTAKNDIYAAIIEGKTGKKIGMKIGSGQFTFGSAWDLSDCGKHWAIWEEK
jgi:glycosidase